MHSSSLETWTLRKEDKQRLSVFENNCLRSLLRKTQIDRMKLDDIPKELGVTTNIFQMIKKKAKFVWPRNPKSWTEFCLPCSQRELPWKEASI